MNRNLALKGGGQDMPGALEAVIRKPVRYLIRPRRDFVLPRLKRTKDYIKRHTGPSRDPVPSNSLGTIGKKRPFTKIAREETKHVLRLLRRSGMPADKISEVAPALARCIVQRELYFYIYRPTSYVFLFILLIPLVYFMRSFDMLQVLGMFYIFIGVSGLIALLILSVADDEYKRRKQFSDKYRRQQYAASKFNIMIRKFPWIVGVIITAIGCIALVVHFIIFRKIIRPTIYELMIMCAQSLLIVLYYVSARWLGGIMVRRRAPELTLIRALADAFEIIATANPANWRSIAVRSKAAQHIGKAAITLEGPIARKFVASAGFADAMAIQQRFAMAGAALRSKIGWLATPRADTRCFLVRALADELLVAATGDLDGLEYADAGQLQFVTISWLARLRTTASWAIFGFGPAIFAVVSRTAGWITDPATTAILVQFAALCFFVAVLSAADPSGYKERLTSVTGTGTALFGWKKAETKD